MDKENHLYLYAVIRNDIHMPSGKMSAQAGHAYTDSLSIALEKDPTRYKNYRNDSLGGSKVTLKAKNENQLIISYNKCIEAGIPCSIVVDREHVLPPDFDGSPIITALGIGPCKKSEVKHITKKFQCL
jgi:PTH2 family peptidyl-tRNA hydrolase